MKAIRIHAPGGPEVMKLEEIPTPAPGDGEILIKLEACGVNYTDVQLRSGNNPVAMPATPGREGAGVVEAVGSGVTTCQAGDRVAYAPIQGGYAEYAVIPADQAVAVPDAMTSQTAAAIMLQGMTAHYLCRATHEVKAGDACLVHAGAGGMGLMLIQMCKMFGATVFTTVSTEAKAELARGAGADHVILYTKVDFEGEVDRIAGPHALDVVYDAVGATTFEKGLNLLKPRGVMALYGAAGGNVPPLDLRKLSNGGSLFVTRPMLGHYLLTRAELELRAGEVMEWVGGGKIDVRIEKTYPLADAAQAHRDLEGRKTTGKLLLIP